MSISPKNQARGSKDCRVWNIKMYWNEEIGTFILGLNATKNMDYMKKKVQIKVVEN